MANEIREHLVRYLSGQDSLDYFEEWFARSTWNLHQDNDPDAEKLAGYIELALAEYTGGVLNPSGLMQRLSHVVRDS